MDESVYEIVHALRASAAAQIAIAKTLRKLMAEAIETTEDSLGEVDSYIEEAITWLTSGQ